MFKQFLSSVECRAAVSDSIWKYIIDYIQQLIQEVVASGMNSSVEKNLKGYCATALEQQK